MNWDWLKRLFCVHWWVKWASPTSYETIWFCGYCNKKIKRDNTWLPVNYLGEQ